MSVPVKGVMVTLIVPSIVATTLEFRAELDDLESRFADRLEIPQVLSRDPFTRRCSAAHRPR